MLHTTTCRQCGQIVDNIRQHLFEHHRWTKCKTCQSNFNTWNDYTNHPCWQKTSTRNYCFWRKCELHRLEHVDVLTLLRCDHCKFMAPH